MKYRIQFTCLTMLFLFTNCQPKIINKTIETIEEVPKTSIEKKVPEEVFSTGRLSAEQGLKDIGTFPIGGAVDITKLLEDEKLQEITIRNFNSITSTNDMKMYSIIPKKNQYKWAKTDSLIAFCTRNEQRLFGHALLWHHGLPKWIEEKTEVEGVEWADRFLQEYIYRVVSRYRGKVAAWDVVNEGFESAGGAYRETFWYKTLGKRYIAKAFHVAHRADPDADLFYNDFNMERDTAKLHAVLQMIEELKAQGTPITGLGFQMHIRMDTPDEAIAYALQEAAKTGLKIHVSELDIIFNSHNDSQGGGEQTIRVLSPKLLQAQADKYKNLVKMYRKYIPKPQQYGITFWDFTDRDTWIRSFFEILDWPTVFDEQLERKPAYYGFAKGLVEDIE